MISRFLRNQEAVIATLAEENHKLSMLTTAECDKLQNLEMILQPCKYVFLPVISMFYTVHTPLSTPFGTPSASIPLSLSLSLSHTHTHFRYTCGTCGMKPSTSYLSIMGLFMVVTIEQCFVKLMFPRHHLPSLPTARTCPNPFLQ